MCIVSMISEDYYQKYPQRWPEMPIPTVSTPSILTISGHPTLADFEALRSEVESLRTLLLKAKKFDKKTGQENCEMGEKVEFVKKLAAMVGVDMYNVFPEKDKSD